MGFVLKLMPYVLKKIRMYYSNFLLNDALIFNIFLVSLDYMRDRKLEYLSEQ